MPQPPDQASPSDSVVFSRFTGLKNTVGRTRLANEELELAINVDIDDVGQLRRRRGYTQVATGNFHSLYTADNGTVYGVKNGALGLIMPDYSFHSLGRTIGANPGSGEQLSYAQVGPSIYFSSPSDSGIIDTVARTVGPWGSSTDLWLSPVVNPTANLPQIKGKLLGAPPRASIIANFNGRIYLAQGNMVWATELYLYNYVDKTKNFWQFEAPVTMIGVVTDGLYIGTQEGAWFITGPTFAEMKRKRVMDSPVIAGTAVYIPGELANPPQVGTMPDTPLGVSVAFMTTNGFCAGQEGGQCFNLTESKVIFPVAATASAMFRRQDGVNQYVATLNSGGTPACSSRIGDYLDAELVRAGSWLDLSERTRLSDKLTYDYIPKP